MRVLALAIVAFGAVCAVTPAQAQTYDPAYPVCLQIYQGSMVDYYFECAYQTMGQCQASASGRSASCVMNPYYAGRGGKPVPRRKKPYHH